MQQNNQQGNHCIHCSVSSCKHNHKTSQLCQLNAINVCPTPHKSNAKPDESMCDSYEH